MENKIYSPELVEKIKCYNYIPRKLKKNEHLKLYHRYWIPDLGGMIKVKDIWKEGNIEYYLIKYKNDMCICFSYPIDDYYESFELLHDYDNICSKNIINSNEFYSGAEIKYWFACNYSSKYNKFLKYLNPNTNSHLNDNIRYKVIITPENNYVVEKENK